MVASFIRSCLVGIVVDITLDTVPLYKVLAESYVTSDDVLTNGVATNWAKTTDHLMIHWFPAFKEVVVSNLTFVAVQSPGNARTNVGAPATYDNLNMIASKIKEMAMDLASDDCYAASSYGIASYCGAYDSVRYDPICVIISRLNRIGRTELKWHLSISGE